VCSWNHFKHRELPSGLRHAIIHSRNEKESGVPGEKRYRTQAYAGSRYETRIAERVKWMTP
jgi:hypothetical protein